MASWMRWDSPPEGEVVEADFVEELQAGADFFQDFVSDFGLGFSEFEFGEKFARFLDR